MLKNGQDVEIICGKDKGKKAEVIGILKSWLNPQSFNTGFIVISKFPSDRIKISFDLLTK